jgi:hypothetical protein
VLVEIELGRDVSQRLRRHCNQERIHSACERARHYQTIGTRAMRSHDDEESITSRLPVYKLQQLAVLNKFVFRRPGSDRYYSLMFSTWWLVANLNDSEYPSEFLLPAFRLLVDLVRRDGLRCGHCECDTDSLRSNLRLIPYLGQLFVRSAICLAVPYHHAY